MKEKIHPWLNSPFLIIFSLHKFYFYMDVIPVYIQVMK